MGFKWNKDKEEHVRRFYNDEVKISPAILAYKLKVPLLSLVNKMNELKIRNRREHERTGKMYEPKDYQDNWWPETHRRIRYSEMRWIRARWFIGGMLTMFGILWTVGWLLGL